MRSFIQDKLINVVIKAAMCHQANYFKNKIRFYMEKEKSNTFLNLFNMTEIGHVSGLYKLIYL